MGYTRTPEPVRLIMGILAKDQPFLEQALALLSKEFGPVEFTLGPIPFRWTNYYKEELGDTPLRVILAFENPISRERMPDIKLWTNQQEHFWAQEGLRPVNLDPGYMTLGQFFLATTKDQRQRVYVRDGIFVEPTLYFEGGTWKPFEWTYRDWQSEEYREFFTIARQRFAYQRTTGRSWRNRSEK